MNPALSIKEQTFDSVEMFGLSLDKDQIKAATSTASRLAIVASAGSGKTRVITQRIKYLCETTDLKPNQVIAITFTRKAGFELAKRIRSVLGEHNRLQPTIGTLHSFVMSELVSFYGEKFISSDSIVESPEKILETLKIKNPNKISRAISWCKSNLIFPQHLSDSIIVNIRKHIRINPREFSLELFKGNWEAYENYLTKNRLYSHDDLLIKYLRLLDDPGYLETRQYLYRHLFVDEFQDSTYAHVEIYKKIVGNKINITAVGDPDQSIFAFAGSSEKYLNNFSNYFPGASIEFLSTNYRSTKANVTTSRSVLGELGEIREIKTPRNSTIIPTLHLYSDEQSEASGIMNILMSSHARGVSFSEMAVLVRTNKQKDLIMNAANKLGITYHRGRRIELNEKASEVFDAINSLRKKRRWKSIYDALDDMSSIESDDEAVSAIYKQLRISAREYMDLFSYDKQGDVSGFFEFLEYSLTGSRDSKDGFSILTFHQSKGLEFVTCIVSGFEKGLVPLYSDRTRKSEEARLAYVALSRASDELHITRAKVRTLFDKVTIQNDSEFLVPIKANIDEIDLNQDFFTVEDALKRISDIRAKHLE